MLEFVYEIEGTPQRFRFTGAEVTIGRSSDNLVVLNDFSVSRRHAILRREGTAWIVADQNSTNGVKVNGRFVTTSPVVAGDVLTVGTFTLTLQEAVTQPEPVHETVDASATVIRSIADFNRDYGLDVQHLPASDDESPMSASGRRAIPEGSRGKIFEILVQVAKTLIVAREVNEILSKVMDLTFEYLRVDRAAVVLLDDQGRLIPMLARERGKKHSDAGTIYSHTIVENVVREKVALLTSDALTDGRFEAGQSIRIQQIRSAMCVPLWNLDRVIGALHVDTPLRVGTFNADDLDLLVALGNFAAVAIDRARLQKRIEQEERIRERLSRYHSPAVVEEIVADAGVSGQVEAVRIRDVSVYFADIVGFTTAAEKMQPEDLSRFLGTVFTFAADAIFAEGGTLDKFIGDAVMAFFGAPIAHADHARRAISAAAKLIEDVKEWNAQRLRHGETAVAVRIGINTGHAVVGDIGSDRRVDYTVLGNTVNIASRLEEHVAAPNEIVVGAETAYQAREFFRFEPLGDLKLKGLSVGTKAYRVALDERGVPLPPEP
jgi:adenylate cyclase